MYSLKSFTLLAVIAISNSINAKQFLVGPSRTYTKPSQVASLVNDNDTIYIEAATYSNDAVKWTKKHLKIIGLVNNGNRPILQYSGDIPNGKGIFVFELNGAADDPYIENLVFDGAQVSDANGANGAGIRFQACNLTVNHCKFLNCQNGILEGNSAVNSSNVTLINSEFFNNGYQLPNDPTYSGYEHNIYIGASTDTLLVQNCYFHQPRGQANSLKTRAQRNFILNNFIDEASGYGSWELNIAQGGLCIIMGNVIIQGNASSNRGIIGYYAATNALQDFYFIHNTVINKNIGTVQYFNVVPTSGITNFVVRNNLFVSVSGSTTNMLSGNTPGNYINNNNVQSNDLNNFGFKDIANGKYQLTAACSTAIDAAINAGNSNTAYPLLPKFMYQSVDAPMYARTTQGAANDIGAYEYTPNVSITSLSGSGLLPIKLYPNPCYGLLQIEIPEGLNTGILTLYNATGQCLRTIAINGQSHIEVDQIEGPIWAVLSDFKN